MGDDAFRGGVHDQRRIRTGRLPHRKGAPVLLAMLTLETFIIAGGGTFPHDQLSCQINSRESTGLGIDATGHAARRRTREPRPTDSAALRRGWACRAAGPLLSVDETGLEQQ